MKHVESALKQYHEQGYTILPEILSKSEIQSIHAALSPYLQDEYPGRNDFEGFNSERVYGLLAKSPALVDLAIHPVALSLLDRLLEPNYLLSAFLAIQIHPGETPQNWHFDDGFVRQPRPRPCNAVSIIWALDDFTETNGATELLPGTHIGPAQEVAPAPQEIVKAIMPAGSMLLFSGLLYHRGGGNQSQGDRLALTPQYCQPWIRQQENMMLSMSVEDALNLPPRARELMGYSIHPPFMGHVNGRHPEKLRH